MYTYIHIRVCVYIRMYAFYAPANDITYRTIFLLFFYLF